MKNILIVLSVILSYASLAQTNPDNIGLNMPNLRALFSGTISPLSTESRAFVFRINTTVTPTANDQIIPLLEIKHASQPNSGGFSNIRFPLIATQNPQGGRYPFVVWGDTSNGHGTEVQIAMTSGSSDLKRRGFRLGIYGHGVDDGGLFTVNSEGDLRKYFQIFEEKTTGGHEIMRFPDIPTKETGIDTIYGNFNGWFVKTPLSPLISNVITNMEGLLIPGMTTTQRNAIGSPANSLTIYNTTTGNFQSYIGGVWTDVISGIEQTGSDGNKYLKTKVNGTDKWIPLLNALP